jgi:MerR HTH family regulatory protein
MNNPRGHEPERRQDGPKRGRLEGDSTDLPVIEPDAETTYTLELVAEMTGVSSKTILYYQEQGLISTVAGEDPEPRLFDTDALRTLRRIEHLRTACQLNLSGLKLMLGLLDEIDRLHAQLRARR